ncbi:hypothetical protein GGTG_07458 [Gaeumannomyces tritici R3-111a-1]|uniref:Copper transport protein n=1 Tax=Gaeumannomyces tritici (strain R3-111a-1) TaxID=644352 RepID=J3P1R0_GAET3|nr:hypothetical protein GGTG_07458 [Gaeumannomyces tritici R3-111a-1]EJT73602.1 hypothetical protein GGTG_07458 [Gaeumannomyces tritici R3-111a-1]
MSHHSSGGGGNATECKMTMLFNTHTIDACFLTADWHIKNEGMFAATCIGVLLLVVYATFRATPPQQLVRAVLHAVTFGLAYIVMLIAMYYNVILLVMIVLGAGIGKFFCDWMTRTILIDGGGPAGGGATAAGPAKAVGVEEPSVCCG